VPLVRKAQRSDAKALAEIAEATFRDAFSAANTADNMELHCRSSYGETIQAGEIDDPSLVTLISEEGQHLIGFAQLRWSKKPSCVTEESAGEIQRIYVAQAWHGQGVAQDLMDAAIAELRKRGSKVVWLGVWEHNPRAITFYKKLGFSEVGDHVFALGRDPQRDILMARAL
jgi:diamine N-acetyltransferase